MLTKRDDLKQNSSQTAKYTVETELLYQPFCIHFISATFVIPTLWKQRIGRRCLHYSEPVVLKVPETLPFIKPVRWTIAERQHINKTLKVFFRL